MVVKNYNFSEYYRIYMKNITNLFDTKFEQQF